MWSDLALFAMFKKGHIIADQVYFLSSIPKNLQVGCVRTQFSSLKLIETLKMNIYFALKFSNTFLLLPRTIAKKKIEIKNLL